MDDSRSSKSKSSDESKGTGIEGLEAIWSQFKINGFDVDQYPLFIDDLGEQIANTELEESEMEALYEFWTAVSEEFETVSEEWLAALKENPGAKIDPNELYNAVLEAVRNVYQVDTTILRKFLHKLQSVTSTGSIAAREHMLEEAKIEAKLTNKFVSPVPVVKEGNPNWLRQYGVNQIVQSGGSYVTSFDNSGKGQYSRAYTVNISGSKTYVIHVHWGGGGAVRSARIKATADQYKTGAAVGYFLTVTTLKSINLPLSTGENLDGS